MSAAERFRRRPRDVAAVAGRWALASVVDPLRLVAHRAWWTGSRRLEDDELDLPALDRPLPGEEADLQRASAGVGPLFVRRYRLLVATTATPQEALDALRDDLDGLVPHRFVRFLDADRAPVGGGLAVGDEFVARLTGPADGPVRVVGATADELRLATLVGHVEAGEIRFRALVAPTAGGRDRLVLEVHSWARSSRPLVRALYERGGGADVQAYVWCSLLVALAERVEGAPLSRVEVAGRRLPWPVPD